MTSARSGAQPSPRETVALAALLVVAAGHGLWNAATVPPLSGYDAPGHAGYMLTILREGRLPDPLEGWSTFHPPLYYALGAGLWALLDAAPDRVLLIGIRSLGVAAWLVTGWLGYAIVRRRGAPPATAWVATALVLFVPASQMAGVMIGNEALAAAFAAGGLWFALGFSRGQGGVWRAAAAAGLVGLALATKFTGLWVAAALPVAFLTPRANRRALAAYALGVAVLAGPIYVRNLAATGSPVPMTRELEPMRSVEALSVLRPRRVTDYLWIDPRCVLHPSAFVLTGDPRRPAAVQGAMVNVWGATYASTWWDAFGHRIPPRLERHTRAPAAFLAGLGLVPSAVALYGLLAALRKVLRARFRAPEGVFVVMTGVALLTFVVFTVRAPGLSALKGSYLLPLVVPAAVFFARGVELLGPVLQRLAIGTSAAAAALAAILFVNGLCFQPSSTEPTRRSWLSYARQLPGAHLEEALRAFGITRR